MNKEPALASLIALLSFAGIMISGAGLGLENQTTSQRDRHVSSLLAEGADLRVYATAKGIMPAITSPFKFNGAFEGKGVYDSEGRKTGTWTTFWHTGELMQVAGYNHGELEGSFLSFYEDGQIAELGQYHRGERDGEWLQWGDNGSLTAQGSYSQGKANGVWEYWDYSAATHTVGVFVEGIRVGKWQQLQFNLEQVEPQPLEYSGILSKALTAALGN